MTKPTDVETAAGIFAFVAFIGGFAWIRNMGTSDGWSFLLAIALTGVAYWGFIASPRGKEMAEATEVWKAVSLRIRSGYFCFRDGVAFDEESRVGLSPAQYADSIRNAEMARRGNQ